MFIKVEMDTWNDELQISTEPPSSGDQTGDSGYAKKSPANAVETPSAGKTREILPMATPRNSGESQDSTLPTPQNSMLKRLKGFVCKTT
ncbi:hypothetical protein KIN20_034235 [Parelaphostrongylus tenuis]|uniref:Uncharacterized protein n=1 Tax=Parelaphostrongylus tenuis TaxID=148309 RepID=A0AAD5WJI6_PARTN|nr:hypothetical protein KIN20_034235 [Parelaphostrongylus tenuis]